MSPDHPYRRFAVALTTFPALLGAPAQSPAQEVQFPAPGSVAYVQFSEDDSSRAGCPQVYCIPVFGSPTVPLALAPTTFVASNGVDFLSATGRIDADVMHGSVSGDLAPELRLAMNDTYTVHGSASGLVPVTFTLGMEGSFSTLRFGSLDELVAPDVTLDIGRYEIDPAATAFPGVSAFDASTHSLTTHSSSIGHGPATFQVASSVSYTKMVAVGDVFAIGYQLDLSVFVGSVDLSNTATISVTTPDGVFLTSSLAPVPEPQNALLFALGLSSIALLRRRRLGAPR